MFVAGLGIGPTFAVFTIVVQNAVPFQDLGAATSDLTLFRQIGTTVGIAVAFTIFRLNFTWDLLREQLIAAGVPASSPFVPVTAPPGFDPGQLTADQRQRLGRFHGADPGRSSSRCSSTASIGR